MKKTIFIIMLLATMALSGCISLPPLINIESHDVRESAEGSFCFVTAKNGWKYAGEGTTESRALYSALKKCGIFCDDGYTSQCSE